VRSHPRGNTAYGGGLFDFSTLTALDLVTGITSVATTGIQAVGDVKTAKLQGQYGLEAQEKQKELIALQTQANAAASQSNSALAMMQSLKTKETMYLVGGTLLGLGMMVAAVVMLKSDDKQAEAY
jgi:hypothetical protein